MPEKPGFVISEVSQDGKATIAINKLKEVVKYLEENPNKNFLFMGSFENMKGEGTIDMTISNVQLKNIEHYLSAFKELFLKFKENFEGIKNG